MNEVIKRMELLEKRVDELEKQLSMIKQMEHSERVQKYIDNVERARKVTCLLEKMDDASTESVSAVMDEKVSEELRNEFDLNSLEDAHSYLETTEMMITEEEKYLDGIVEDKDWSEIFEYRKNQDGIVISRYIGFDEEEIVVPNKIENFEVVEIGDGAFQNCKSIKKIGLPQSIKRIGDNAFRESGLVEINIPESVLYLGKGGFYWTEIISIRLPDGIKEIMEDTFSMCTKLEKIILPPNIEKIGKRAFNYCQILKKMDIPNSCQEIGEDAFREMGENYRKSINKVHIRIGANLKVINEGSRPYSSVFWDNCSSLYNADIIIYCKAGSYAMEYARKHKISVKKYEEFEELD